jgi:peptidoglycan hydrolase-like protein with peptidoglycan-binding domain
MSTVTNYKYGDKGDGVIALQRQLNSQGYGLKEDGSFGPLTQSALRDFQTKNNLTVDGIYGTQTAGMFNTLAQNKPVVANNAPVVAQTSNVTPNVATAQNGTQNPYDMKFNYDVTKDVGFQNATALAKSKIAEEMAARGIGGSTIEQERIAQSIAGLNLDYTNAAFNKFSTEQQLAIQRDQEQYNRNRQAKMDALEKVQTIGNGIFDNESAKLWGVPPGTRTTDRIARDAQEAQRIADKKAAEANARVVEQKNTYYKDILKANQSIFNTDPTQAVNNILNNPLLSDTEKMNMINSMSSTSVDDFGNVIPTAGKTGLEVLQDIKNAEKKKQNDKDSFNTRYGINVEGATGNPFGRPF